MMSKRNNRIRRTELEDGSAVYLVELGADDRGRPLASPLNTTGLNLEAVVAQAIDSLRFGSR